MIDTVTAWRTNPRMRTAGRHVLQLLIFVAALGLTLSAYFRVFIMSHGTSVWSDHLDGGIETALFEHWYNVLRGASKWTSPNYFYPNPTTLGYNDGFFLYGLIHSFFRLVGFDIAAAAQLVSVVVKAVGFIAFYLFLRAAFSLRFGYALLGATIFTLGHALFMHAFHQQLESIAFAPLLATLAIRAHDGLTKDLPGRFLLFGALAAVWYSAWLLTGYYMAWFFGLFCGCAIILAPMCGGLPAMARTGSLVWRYKLHAAGVIGLSAVSLIPFLVVYLPKLRETGAHSWADALVFSPAPNDALNVGSGNFLFGRVFALFCPRCSIQNYEVMTGIPPILAYLFVCGGAWSLWHRRGTNATLLRVLTVTTVLTWLMVIHFHDHSFWKLIFDWVPGAKAIRVLARYQEFLTFPIIAVVMVYFQSAGGRMPRTMTVIVAAVLMLEQLGTSPGMNDRADILARTAAPRPPAACKAFFATRAKGQDSGSDLMKLYPHNVEAMLIAELVQLPTINGYATFLPPGWVFADPAAPDYLDRVKAYAAKFNVGGLCQLDLQTLTWSGPVT